MKNSEFLNYRHIIDDNEPDDEQIKENIELKVGIKNLDDYLSLLVEDLDNEKIPVTKDCRINIESPSTTYTINEIEKDKEYINRMAPKILLADKKNPYKNYFNKLEQINLGEKFEILQTAIFHKNLSPNFIAIRASLYDDYKNKVDNLIIDKETNNVICGFDDIAEKQSYRYIQKKEDILSKNLRMRGANIKYCLKFSSNKESPILTKIDNVPIFYIALNSWEVKTAIKKFGKDNIYEKKLFESFIADINAQIKKLELNNINKEVSKKWKTFYEYIKTF